MMAVVDGHDERKQQTAVDNSPSNSHLPTSFHSTSDSLQTFFAPSGVAVIGASANPAKLSHGVLRNLVSHGYAGAVYPVNPGREAILDLPCYPDISVVPDPVELAVIILPAVACPAALEACGRRGLKGAVVISGGFREVGPEGLALEERLVEIARRHGMRLIGPNCVGTIDAYTGLNTTFIRTMPHPGHIAFISQSGAICGGILEWTAGKGVGFSRFATLGNEADVSEADLIEALAEDPNTRVIVSYLEAIRDGRRFIDVASRVTPYKPILVIKAGTTAAGTRAVSSHTGSLAGEMAAYDAAFRQSGVIRVDTVEQLFNDALALAYGPLPAGGRVAVITNAGGPASLAADSLELGGLSMPAPSPHTTALLAQHCHPEAQLANPIDMLGGAEPAHYELAVSAALADPAFDATLAILVPQALIDPAAVAEAIGQAAADRQKPVVACFMGDDAVRTPMAVLHRHRIAAYQFPEQAARALAALRRHARWQEGAGTRQARGAAAGSPLVAPEVAGLLDQAVSAGRVHLGEWESRPLLAAYGVPQPQAGLARSAWEAIGLAAAIGYPVALKAVSPDLVHKSEAGGVLLGLADEAAVRAGYEAVRAQVLRARPQTRVEGVLVAEMAPSGHELIVGMRRDPQFGPLLMFGLGGIYVELIQDVAFRVAPFDRAETLRLIAETRAGKLLQGLRGRPPADVEAVADVIERVAELALAFPQIAEIDLNPVFAYERGGGAIAADARIVLA